MDRDDPGLRTSGGQMIRASRRARSTPVAICSAKASTEAWWLQEAANRKPPGATKGAASRAMRW